MVWVVEHENLKLGGKLRSSGISHSLKAAIFDMDGVLIDSHPVHRLAWKEFLQSIGRTVSDRELDFILDGRKRAEILQYFLGKLSRQELEEHGRRKDELLAKLANSIKPLPGVVTFLKKLRQKGVVTAVATSAAGSRARFTLKRLRMLQCFRVVVTGDDVCQGKPDPAIYNLTCTRLNVHPSRAVAIEDAVSGVVSAKRAGLHCVAVSTHQPAWKLTEAGADHVIEGFQETSIRVLESLL